MHTLSEAQLGFKKKGKIKSVLSSKKQQRVMFPCDLIYFIFLTFCFLLPKKKKAAQNKI